MRNEVTARAVAPHRAMCGAGQCGLRQRQQRCGAKMAIVAFAAAGMGAGLAVGVVLVHMVRRLQLMQGGMPGRRVRMVDDGMLRLPR